MGAGCVVINLSFLWAEIIAARVADETPIPNDLQTARKHTIRANAAIRVVRVATVSIRQEPRLRGSSHCWISGPG